MAPSEPPISDIFSAFPSATIEACFVQEKGQRFNVLIRLVPDFEIAERMTGGQGPDWDFCRYFYLDVILEFGSLDRIEAPKVRLRPSHQLAPFAKELKLEKYDFYHLVTSAVDTLVAF